jgi:FkbM family methyltransferase
MSPVRRGKGRIASLLVYPLCRLADKDMSYQWIGAEGAQFHLRFREEIGRTVAAFGSFERAELAALLRLSDSACVYDVGANVGIFTIPLAIRLRDAGRVVAFEPYPPNVARLQSHLALNHSSNVDVLPVAAGDFDGAIGLRIDSDPARATTVGMGAEGRTLAVSCRKLDSVWYESGQPKVVAVKIDVEGSEVAVIRGAARLIEACRPALLIETVDKLASLERLLSPHGYRRSQPPGFMPWNHLFTATG